MLGLRARQTREALKQSEKWNFEEKLAKIDLKKKLKNARVFSWRIVSKWAQLVRRNNKLSKTFNIVVTRATNSRGVKVKWEEEFWRKIG